MVLPLVAADSFCVAFFAHQILLTIPRIVKRYDIVSLQDDDLHHGGPPFILDVPFSFRWFVRSWPCALHGVKESISVSRCCYFLRTQYKLVMQLVGVRIMESLITVSRLDSRFNHLEAESKME
jgi:hypothetical protein